MPDSDKLAAAKARYLNKLVRVMYPREPLAASSAGIVVEVSLNPRIVDNQDIVVNVRHGNGDRLLRWCVDSQERPENWRLEVWDG